MWLLLTTWSCHSDPIAALPPGTARIAFTARGEGEVDPCG